MKRPARGPAWAVAALTLAYIGFGLWIGAGYDTGRDVAAAWAIAREGARPLEGPIFAGQVHLGPVWFYLLAAPLAIAPTWLAPAMTAVVLASLQLPLAYAAGTRLADRRLGLMWAAALLLPGWAGFEQVGFSCTNLIRTCIVATLYCLVRARQTPAARWWFGAGLAASLAIHAHPSAAWLLPVTLVAAVLRPGEIARVLRDRVVAVALVAAGAVLPFLPVLGASTALLAGAAGTAAANVGVDNLSRVPALAVSIAWSGAYALFATLYGADDVPGRVAAVTAASLTAIGAVTGILAALRGNRPACIGLGLTLLSLLFVALLRPVTPLYMAYAVSPCLALLVAAGWRATTRVVAGAAGASLGTGFTVLAVATWALVGIGVLQAMTRGGGRVDGPWVANITSGAAARAPLADVWLPARDVDALGRELCATPGPVYGALPYLLDVHYTLPVRIHCPQAFAAFDVRTGTAAGRLALASARWRDIDAIPPLRVGGLGLAPVGTVIAAPASRGLPRDATYPPHPYASGPTTSVEYAFQLPRGQVVVASNPRVAWMPAWETEVRCNGVPATLASADIVTRVYACAALADPGRWTVSARAQDPSIIEFVAFDPGPPAPAAR